MNIQSTDINKLKQKYAGSLNYFFETDIIPSTNDIKDYYLHNNKSFEYIKLEENKLKIRLNGLLEFSKNNTTEKINNFLQYKILETKFLLATINAKNNANDYTEFNNKLFGKLDQRLGSKLFSYAIAKSKLNHEDFTARHNLVISKDDFAIPESKNFEYNIKFVKVFAEKLSNELSNIINSETDFNHNLTSYIQNLIKTNWTVSFNTNRKASMVDKSNNRLVLGKTFINGTKHTQKRILLHEIIHILRHNSKTFNLYESAFEEGFAHLIERIGTNTSIIPARYWRYLTIWFIESKFNQRYLNYQEISIILIEIYMSIKNCNHAEAEKFVWGLIFRVTKGLLPNCQGLAHHKDLRYAYGSLLVWNYLDTTRMTTSKIAEYLDIDTIN